MGGANNAPSHRLWPISSLRLKRNYPRRRSAGLSWAQNPKRRFCSQDPKPTKDSESHLNFPGSSQDCHYQLRKAVFWRRHPKRRYRRKAIQIFLHQSHQRLSFVPPSRPTRQARPYPHGPAASFGNQSYLFPINIRLTLIIFQVPARLQTFCRPGKSTSDSRLFFRQGTFWFLACIQHNQQSETNRQRPFSRFGSADTSRRRTLSPLLTKGTAQTRRSFRSLRPPARKNRPKRQRRRLQLKSNNFFSCQQQFSSSFSNFPAFTECFFGSAPPLFCLTKKT